jgi:UDPglucose 6-dehydrogenase
MKILMVGTGYVGLVTAACLSEMGNHVICLDIDIQKISNLQKGILPIYEPGLKELVDRNTSAGRLTFTTDYREAVREASVCFIAVPTPPLPDGACDLSYVFSAASEIARHMKRDMILVNKSTVPVGTARQVKTLVSSILKERGLSLAFEVVSNPEFLKEGCAINDCMKPDRIILGIDGASSSLLDASKVMREIYSAFTINHDRIFCMDTVSAELTKYAANSMLALRISFMNELARLCERTGANIKQIRVGIGSDQRIGYQFLYAGAGFGGSCFPKDIRALSAIAKHHGLEMPILESVQDVNERQKQLLGHKILSYFSSQGGVARKKIAIWGLSFKPDTDDLREAPSLTLIQTLLDRGAILQVFDPVAMPNAQKIFQGKIAFCKDEYDAALDADAIVLVTEWKQFRFVDFPKIIPHLKQRVFFDGRNQYQLAEMQALGIEYFGIGVPSSPLKTEDEPLMTLASADNGR